MRVGIGDEQNTGRLGLNTQTASPSPAMTTGTTGHNTSRFDPPAYQQIAEESQPPPSYQDVMRGGYANLALVCDTIPPKESTT